MAKIVKIEGSFPLEAQGIPTAQGPRANPALLAEGWEARFLADGPRVEEVTELYAQLGYEVRTETVQPQELQDDCEPCRLHSSTFRMIYTRRKSP